MGLEHDRYCMARAIMEGMAFELKGIIEYFQKIGSKVNNLIMLGGAARSQLWTEIISDVLGIKIIRMKEADMACVGAAIIAGTGCGMFRDYQDGLKQDSAGRFACRA